MVRFGNIGAAILVALAAAPALAAESQYTPFDLAACTELPVNTADPLETGRWDCPGLADVPVLVAEGDLRFLVSYGADAISQPAFSQTLPPFNHLGDTIEWRLDEAGVPYATIFRFITDKGDGTNGEILVVTRLGDGVCHVAYVDALANPGANELAQQAADLIAPGFSCETNTAIWIGDGGF